MQGSEKLCLQWNNFKENVASAFGKLRNKSKFYDITFVCEDGEKIEAHKVISDLIFVKRFTQPKISG